MPSTGQPEGCHEGYDTQDVVEALELRGIKPHIARNTQGRRSAIAARKARGNGYITGQRPADVQRMNLADIKDGALEVRQGKTGALVRIAVEGRLVEVILRIKNKAASRRMASMMMLADKSGRLIGLNAFSRRLRAAVEAARLSGTSYAICA